jgi:predicted peroxiredoxin
LGAVEAGHQPQILLAGEAVYLMKSYIVEQVHGVGWPPLKELFQKVIGAGIPFYV